MEQKQVIEQIPANILAIMQTLNQQAGRLNNQMLRLSIQLLDMETMQKDLRRKMKEIGAKYQKEIKKASKKLKLNKRTDYKWQFNGEAFVGTPNSTKEKNNEI